MISIIIPTYNRSIFLEQALRSVCIQSFSDTELIVVDDGSTDDTRSMVVRVSQELSKNIQYIYQKNSGAAAARNTGIRAARYDTICFLDSDDSYMPEKLVRQYKLLQNSPLLISHTKEIWYRQGYLLQQKKKHQPPHGDIFTASLRMCMVGMSTVMVRREVFKKYGFFDETLPCCEDYDFWLRVSTCEHFLLVPEPLTLKNGGRADQLSVQYRQGMDKFRIAALVKLLSSKQLKQQQFRAALTELKRKCSIYGEGCLKHGKKAEGKVILEIPVQFEVGPETLNNYNVCPSAAGTAQSR